MIFLLKHFKKMIIAISFIIGVCIGSMAFRSNVNASVSGNIISVNGVYKGKLAVDIIQDEKKVLLKSGSVLFTDKDVSFYPDSSYMQDTIDELYDEILADERNINGFECDGKNITYTPFESFFLGYVMDGNPLTELTEDCVTIQCPDDVKEYEERTVIFIKTVSVGMTKIEDGKDDVIVGTRDVVLESDPFYVVFDRDAPTINISGDIDENGYFTAPSTVSFYAEDYVSGIRGITVSSSGKELANINLSSKGRITGFTNDIELPVGVIKDGRGEIEISATDNSGHVTTQAFQFLSDSEPAKIIALGADDGKIYKDKTKAIYKISDNFKGLNVKYECRYISPEGKEKTLEEYETEYSGDSVEIEKSYDKEGIYEISIGCTDAFGNESDLLYRSFGIDKSSPVISFDGVEKGAVISNKAEVGINVNELFYESMNVDVSVMNVNDNSYMSIPVGKYDYGAVNNKNTYSFTGNGVYIINVSAEDKSGHRSEASTEFTIDSTPPEVIVTFDDKEDVTSAVLNNYPKVTAIVRDKYYEGAEIAVNLVKKKEGNILEKIPTDVYRMTQSEMRIPILINEEGVYDLSVSATDSNNNKSVKKYSFTVDGTPPVIGYLSDFNERYLKSFRLPENLSDYITDITSVKYKAYLNSKETGPGEIKKDGKYILQVVAWDDAGNENEEMIAFIIDNTKPSVVISGLNQKGEIQNNIPVKLSLYNSDDYFTEVYVNGQKKDLSKDRKTCEFTYDKSDGRDSCRIYVSARDEANNVLVQTIDRKCEFMGASVANYNMSDSPKLIKLSAAAVPEKSIANEDELLPKTDAKFLHNKNEKNITAVIWIICGILCGLTVILVTFAFVDSAKNKC